MIASHKACIAGLDAACAAVEAELDARIKADPERAGARRLLASISGIGARVAGVPICDLPELGQRDRKSIASPAGLAPMSASRATPRRAP